MDIKEYQAKKLFKIYGLNVLPSAVASSVGEALDKAKNLKEGVLAVKAQVLAGGRGKAGGIKIVKSKKEVEEASKELLGQYLVTPQTSKQGELIKEILIEEGCNIKKEFYLAALLDTDNSQVTFMASSEGGMDIEEIGEKTPEKILKVPVSLTGDNKETFEKIAQFLNLESAKKDLFLICEGMKKLFLEKDANLIEINPLAQNEKGQLVILDAKMSFDENALYRQKDLEEIYKNQERLESEKMALEEGISYIKLDGSIACMVNGAGLAMATMDIIKFYKGEPANFLDVGGGASEEKVKKAFEIILKSKDVKSILVNIFGGIMRCDIIASALIHAVKDMGIQIPVVVRLEGTKSKEGMETLNKSGLKFITAENLDDAAKKVVELS